MNKTKDLYRDVKRRFSSFNSPTNSLKLELSNDCNLGNNNIVCCTQSKPAHEISSLAKLRRYASDESLSTSESGCGSSKLN